MERRNESSKVKAGGAAEEILRLPEMSFIPVHSRSVSLEGSVHRKKYYSIGVLVAKPSSHVQCCSVAARNVKVAE